MADPNYAIPENPIYDPEIRALQDSDPARASTVFNPVLEKMIVNTHAVKLAGDSLAKSVKALEEAASQPGDASDIVLPGGATVADAIGDLETSKAGLASPAFTGTPKAPTPATGSNDTTVATTGFVKAQGYASLASPTLTGAPKAPTPAPASNDTSIATTAFVKGQGSAATDSPAFTGTPTAPTPANGDNSTKLATTAFVKNQGFATLASPTFTGSPKAPTPAASASDTQLATTAFVKTALGTVANGLFQLVITFGSTLKGKAFTVSGAGFTTYSGTVPAGLKATVPVTQPNTTYTLACDGNTKTVATTSYFGVYSVSIDATPAVFNDATWDQIAAAVANGNVPATWTIGSEKNITLTTGEALTVQIYGKNHDDLASGGKAALTFGLKNLMAANQQMNSSNTNVGGFTGSALYTWLQGTLYNSLPADLRAAIKSVNKKTSAGNQSSTINTNAMKIFLFSEVECFGTTTYSAAGEGAQYPIFTDNASRIKKQSNGAGSAHYWWERSPNTSSATSFCAVHSNGNAGSYGASYAYGVSFGFCI